MPIEVRNLCHLYQAGTPFASAALKDVSFSIADGEFVGLIGHTGSGKSTLIQHLNALLKPTSGEITIDGLRLSDKGVSLKEIRKRVGLVFQYPEYQLFEETVAKDVAFGPKNLGLSEAEVEDRVREAIGLVGLDYEKIKDRSPFELSGGQKRRVAIAGVLAMKPQVLVLDEPTAGLDPGAHKDILDMIREVHRVQNNIIIFVSHNMGDIADLSDKVMVMNDGRLVMVGTPEDVFGQKARLAEIGLAVPPVTELMHELKDAGIPVKENILNLKEAETEIYQYLQRKLLHD